MFTTKEKQLQEAIQRGEAQPPAPKRQRYERGRGRGWRGRGRGHYWNSEDPTYTSPSMQHIKKVSV